MNGPFLAGILGWEVLEDPGNGRFSSAWLKNLTLSQKKTVGQTLGTFLTKS